MTCFLPELVPINTQQCNTPYCTLTRHSSQRLLTKLPQAHENDAGFLSSGSARVLDSICPAARDYSRGLGSNQRLNPPMKKTDPHVQYPDGHCLIVSCRFLTLLVAEPPHPTRIATPAPPETTETRLQLSFYPRCLLGATFQHRSIAVLQSLLPHSRANIVLCG